MKLITITALFTFINILIFAQEKTFNELIDFNGYVQIRATSNFDDNTSFSVRRLKLWVKSKPEFSEHWSYKIQSTISSFSQEKFFLQDVKIGYKIGLFSFDIGQFVPQYSLQRFQADYELPVTERSIVIDRLIPNATFGVRDIGIQANFNTKNKLFETHLGLFNGYGIKEYRFENKAYMLTNKSALNIQLNNDAIKIGYSLQYREAENLKFSHVLPDSVLFSGTDLRYNLFAMFQNKFIELTAEYLNADLENQKADGYYFLAAVNIKKSQIVLSFEDYNDIIDSTSDDPYYHLGFNYLINHNKIKLFFDNYFQINHNNFENNITTVQLQMFFK